MEKTNIIFCKTKDDIEELRKDSSITWEALDTSQNNLKDLFDWVENFTEVLERTVHVTKGKLMNESYGLTGKNAYPDEISIVSIKSSCLKNMIKLTIPGFITGGRWMDDIIANNLEREYR